jgi:peptide/nickel transport system substrate-binding protein
LGFVSGYPKNERDIQKAKAYLDEGGFADLDGDGFRETPDGKPIDLSILIYYYPPDLVPKYKRIAEMMQINLAEVGIRVHPDEQSLANNRDYILDTIRNNEYELWLGSTTMSTATWGGIANYVADTQVMEVVGRSSFFGTYRDPDYLDAYYRMMTSTNAEDYIRAYADAQRINADQTTAIVWDVTKAFHPYRSDKITGWVNYPGMGVFNTATWYNAALK